MRGLMHFAKNIMRRTRMEDLWFYANPFTQGGREQHQYQTFGDVLPSLSL